MQALLTESVPFFGGTWTHFFLAIVVIVVIVALGVWVWGKLKTL